MNSQSQSEESTSARTTVSGIDRDLLDQARRALEVSVPESRVVGFDDLVVNWALRFFVENGPQPPSGALSPAQRNAIRQALERDLATESSEEQRQALRKALSDLGDPDKGVPGASVDGSG